MNISRTLATLALTGFFTPALATNSHLSLTVVVYDYVNVRESTLEEAEAVASRIMRRAGVEIEWVEHTPNSRRRLTGTDLVLRLVPEKMMASWKLDSSHMAFSLVTRNSQFSHIAGILTDRVERSAERHGYPLELVLGHVMAHEFGHLLLRDKRHAVAGVMSFPLDQDYLVRASKGMQTFTSGQARRIRREVAKRTEMAQAEPGPPNRISSIGNASQTSDSPGDFMTGPS